MAESKYGRLFTEADATKLIRAAYEQGYDDAQVPGVEGYDHVVLSTLVESDGPMSFPPDEPLFLLRGQDRFAPDGVSGYFDALQIAEDAEGEWLVSAAHRDAVADAGSALDRWQAEHPDRVKVPD